MRQALWRIELNLNLAPVAVFILVVWTVPEHILVAQLYSYLGCYIGQFIGITDGEQTPAGHLRDIVEQDRTVDLLLLAGHRAEDTDGINLDIGFLHHGFDLIFRVAAVVIAAVRDDQQGLLAVAGILHLTDPHVDSVKKRGTALGDGIDQLALDLLD